MNTDQFCCLGRHAATTHIHTYIHIYIHTYIHMYIHTYIHTYSTAITKRSKGAAEGEKETNPPIALALPYLGLSGPHH